MKRRFLFMGFTIFVACFFVAGFGAINVTWAKTTYLKIGAGPVGGAWFPLAATLSSLIGDNIKDVKASPTVGGSVGNLNGIENGSMQLGTAHSFNVLDSYLGRDPFTKANPKLRALASMYIAPLQIITKKKSNIKTPADLKGRPFSPGTKGFGGEVLFHNIIKYYGMDYKDLGSVSYLGYSDGALTMKDGHIDIYVALTTAPNSSFMDVDVSDPVTLFDVGEKGRQDISLKYGLAVYEVPGSAYKGMEGKSVKCLASATTFVISSDVPEDIVYEITKVMWKNYKEFHSISPDMVQMVAPKNALLGFVIPLHKGAYKYYKEIGLDIPKVCMPKD